MRSPFIALIRKDIKGYFDQPTGYILIVVFVSMLSWAYFKTALLIGEASLRPLFTVEFAIDRPSLPWLMTLFIPAATMRLLSEEQRDGTLETLLTQPIRGWVVLLTKFLSGLIFVSIAILFTLGIPISIMNAGNLDWGAVVSQYIGSIFLAGALVSIGLFTSSLTRNQIVAFILGLTLSMLLMIVGLEIVAVTLPSNVANLLQLLSPLTHFDNVGRGIIDLRDILYFVALISTFLSATFLILRSRTLSHKTPQYRNLQLGVAGLIILSLAVGWFGTSIKGRMDLTEDKIFSLDNATVEILKTLDDLMTVDVYLSKDPPVQVSPVSRDINDFLDDFESSGNNMVKVVRHYPEDNEDDLKKADAAGIPAVQFNVRSQGELQIKNGYMGIVLTYLDKREIIPFVESVDGFEYRLAILTNKMVTEEIQRKTVGFLTGHGEMEVPNELSAFASVLSQQYNVAPIAPNDDGKLNLSDIEILVVASPKARINEQERQNITEFINNGGKAFFNIEPVLVDFQQLGGLKNRDSFSDYIQKHFGVIVEDNLVYDLQANETISFSTGVSGNVFLPYPYWVKSQVLDRKVGGDVRTVVMPWSSSIGILDLPGSQYNIQPLIATTEYAAIDETYRNLSPNSPVLSDPLQTTFFKSDLAVTAENQAGSRVIIVGDADWISQDAIQRFSGNALLALNLLDWLAQEDNLASVRSKVVLQRSLIFPSKTHKNLAQYANIGGIPILLIVLGVLRYLQRMSKGFANPWRKSKDITNAKTDLDSSEGRSE